MEAQRLIYLKISKEAQSKEHDSRIHPKTNNNQINKNNKIIKAYLNSIEIKKVNKIIRKQAKIRETY